LARQPRRKNVRTARIAVDSVLRMSSKVTNEQGTNG
jgi:hypothetical protein